MTLDLKQTTSQFLADRHSLSAFIQGLVREPDASEDIFQEVWIRLSAAVETGMDIQDVPKWCRGVARNLILHHRRGKRTSKVVADSRILEITERAFDEQDNEREYWSARHRALMGCVRSLPEKARSVLELKYVQGLRAAAIAERVQKSCENVLMILSRVRRLLSDCVEKKLTAAAGGHP